MGGRVSRGERSHAAVATLHTPDRSHSFAEFVAVLERLNALESAIASAVGRARVPVQEVRKVLRSQTPDQAENTPAFQFMRQVFSQVGLPLTLEAVARFSLTFGLEETPYARLFARDRPAKTCGFVSEAIARFLTADLGLPAAVEEVACRNNGNPACLFAAALDPASVRKRVLDGTDWDLLERLAAGEPPTRAGAGLGIEEAELHYRVERLVGYGIASVDGRLLPEGLDLSGSEHVVEEAFETPWREVTRLMQAIADAASFAEAVSQVAPREAAKDLPADKETAALAAECRSFAELLARASKGRSWE